jgi:hypothetical protein
MKKGILIAVTIVIVGAMAQWVSISALSNDADSIEVITGISQAIVPGGFDGESEVFTVVSGTFPNTCYEWSRADIRHGREVSVTEIRAIANVKQGLCLMLMQPYSKEIEVGVLGRGKHTLRFVSGDGTYFEKHIELE